MRLSNAQFSNIAAKIRTFPHNPLSKSYLFPSKPFNSTIIQSPFFHKWMLVWHHYLISAPKGAMHFGKVPKGRTSIGGGWESPIGQLEFTKWEVWGIILRVDWFFLNKKHELRKNTLSLSRLCALLGESGETTRLKTLRASRKTMKKNEWVP